MKMITQQELKKLLNYNPITGVFNCINSKRIIKNGRINNRGYITFFINKKSYLAHRLAWLYVYGNFPKDCIDHINHVKTDNRINNLRECSPFLNGQNNSKRKDNKSGFTGVFFSKSVNKWQVQIRINKKPIHLGIFENIDDAIECRKVANIKYGFHENHGK